MQQSSLSIEDSMLFILLSWMKGILERKRNIAGIMRRNFNILKVIRKKWNSNDFG